MTPAQRRSSRSRPADGRPFRTTERDTWLLEAIAKMRFVTTGELARLGFGGSRSAASKRLRKLLDARLVRVWTRSLAEENVYSITLRGAALAFETNGTPARPPIPRGLDGNLDHLLAINEVRVGVAVGLSEVGGELLWWRSDWDLRAGGRGAAVPDALFLVDIGGKDKLFTLEVEHAGKSPRKFLGKILRYRAMGARRGALYGVSDFGLLVVGRDDRSIERSRQFLACMPQGMSIWFTSLGEMAERGALGSIWRPVQGHERYSLRDL